jgi:hypothetical protein
MTRARRSAIRSSENQFSIATNALRVDAKTLLK